MRHMEPLPSVPVGQQMIVPLLEHSLQDWILGNFGNPTLEFPDLPGPTHQAPSTLGTTNLRRAIGQNQTKWGELLSSLKQKYPGEREVTGHSGLAVRPGPSPCLERPSSTGCRRPNPGSRVTTRGHTHFPSITKPSVPSSPTLF